MKKISRRSYFVLLLALAVIFGMVYYVLTYIDHGRDWALYFSEANSGSSGELIDRNGVLIASFDSTSKLYAEDELTRRSCYHVTGDYWGRTGTGLLTNFWKEIQGFSLISGTTKGEQSTFSLNIDSNLNNVAFEALGDRNGAVMLCNYKTGEVICMVSTPSVDPLDAEAEPPEGAYINRCLSATFAPGSVFKLVTAAAAIEQLPDIYQRSFFCQGEYDVAGVTITCSGVHNTQTFEQALANSCNCAFAQIAIMLGQNTMIEYVEKYGFLSPSTLNGINTAAGNYPTDFVGDPELAWSGIGQSTDLVCPYSLLRYVSAVANSGVLVEPSLISDDAAPLETRLMNEDTANRLAAMMNYNVTAHYDPENNFPGLKLCAKTGTAEVSDKLPHAWFAGFLNDEEHPYAFVVLVENGGYGLSAAGAVANTILQAATGD